MKINPLKNAFTLIELLIVVAIIAILAAIAVPNFLEAQTRSKVSRVKSDMRTMATALESYYVDRNAYPNPHPFGIASKDYINNPTQPMILERLSTPVAYITTALLKDVFDVNSRYSAATAAGMAAGLQSVNPTTDVALRLNSFIYQAFNGEQRPTLPADGFTSAALNRTCTAWVLHSAGPDSGYHNLGGVLANDRTIDGPILLIYDPTNGTISFGSIYRSGGAPGSTAAYAGGSGLIRAIDTQN